MRRASMWLAVGIALVIGAGCGDASVEPDAVEGVDAVDVEAPFIGTWELENIESREADGTLRARDSELPMGFLMYDAAGYMGVVIMGRDRQPYAGEQRTPEEALRAFSSYTSYFGEFSVDGAEQEVTHHLRGSLNPRGKGSDYVRGFDFESARFSSERGQNATMYSTCWAWANHCRHGVRMTP